MFLTRGNLRAYRGDPLKMLMMKQPIHVSMKKGGEDCVGPESSTRVDPWRVFMINTPLNI